MMSSPNTQINFTVTNIKPQRYSLTPQLVATVNIATDSITLISAIALRCQIRIEPLRRHYTEHEEVGLTDLFGPRSQWVTTQKTFVWQHLNAMVPSFTGTTEVNLVLECTYDLEVAATKYFHALEDDAIPLIFLFSGTLFTSGKHGLNVEQVSWDCEDRYDMPVSQWQDLMTMHFPHSGWVRLPHNTITALANYKSAHGMLDFNEAITTLLTNSTSTELSTNGCVPRQR